MRDKFSVLSEYFGHKAFREGQEAIVDSLASGRDVLCIMPTGAGKSICYQVPALMFDGITIVVSPLISLMKDQVSSLVESGVPAAYINSSLSPAQYSRVLQNTADGRYKIIYVAPERLAVGEFLAVCSSFRISMIAIDEAHCISQWGQDFRPSYLKIKEFIGRLPYRPVVGAFTATATNDVKEDILRILQLQDPYIITTGFDRPNLYFGVIKTTKKNDELLSLLQDKRKRSGIVYCATRKNVEEVCGFLNERGYSATRYHAGLTENERRANQDDFVFDRKTIMVATNAFGMGIDKSNVSFVIHYNMPKNIESYYQEAGRAGRDGSEADCILLYSPADVRTNQFLIEKSEGNPELTPEEQAEVRQRDFERLKYMTFYCTTNDCLRGYILRYFGDRSRNEQYCGKCSNCLASTETVDATIDAQKILSCIAKTGERFGKKMIIDVLRGSESNRILQLELNEQSTYGIMSSYTEKHVREIIDHLICEGYLGQTDREYPILVLNSRSYDVLRGRARVSMRTAKAETIPDVKPTTGADKQTDSILEALKKLRRSLAERHSVPAYVIFSDATLVDMCKKRPLTPEELLEVSGVGKAKLEKYGAEFLAEIRKYANR